MSVRLGTGTGSFAPHTPFSVGIEPRSVEIGDLSGDGRPDLAVANIGSSSVSVLLGTGTGSFASQTTFPVGTNPLFVAIGDLNGDGRRDLTTANQGSSTVSAHA